MTVINGLDVNELEGFREVVASDAEQARMQLSVTAGWLGGDASRVSCGSATLFVGGDDNFNAMQALLASLAACEVDVIATHAALIGLHVEELEIEATGHCDLRAYLAIDQAPGSGYDQVTYRARLRAPGATPEQVAYLTERCERSSPVGDTLVRSVPVKLELEAADA